MARIKKKKYYRISFVLTSPLAVGSGENEVTDRDIACDSRGIPYIPGSAMAGMFRHEVKEYEKNYKKYFGDIPKVKSQETEDSQKKDANKDENSESRVIVYDATIEKESGFVTKRDMVALDEYKTAIPGSKFDFQILEPGVKFVTYLEQNIYDGDDEEVLDPAIARMSAGEMVLGAKTRRGYGHVKTEKVKTAIFCMEKDTIPNSEKEEQSLEDWLEIDIFNENSICWREWRLPESSIDSKKNWLRVELLLAQKGGLSVRQYSTKPGDADYMQMKLHGENGACVIPGTTWAGAFRSHLKKLGLKETDLIPFFGEAKKKGGFRSKISFGESEISDGTDVIYSRNAIDRFTGGTIDGALYTESIHYHGSTRLEIGLEAGKYKSAEKFCRALAASIVDLHEGYLAVGGLTSVGRGMFSLTEIRIDGQKLDVEFEKPEEMYHKIFDGIWEAVKKWEYK